MDVVRETMQIVGVRDEDADGGKWRTMIRCGDSQTTQTNKKEEAE